MGFSSYSSDADSNLTISGINIAEGCPPSGINNAIRQLMADAKDENTSAIHNTGAQTISGSAAFLDAVTIANGATVTSGGMTVTGDTVISGGMTVTGDTVISGGASVTSDMVIDGSLTVTSGATISGGMTLTGNTDTTGNFQCHNTSGTRQINFGVGNTGNGGLYDATNSKWMIVADSSGSVTVNGHATDDVTLSTTQTISGAKTFSTNPVIATTTPYLYLRDTDAVISTSAGGMAVAMQDKNGFNMGFLRTVTDIDANSIRLTVQDGHESSEEAHAVVALLTGIDYGYTFCPLVKDDLITLGRANWRWKQVYASTSTIGTSDERKKSNIAAIPDNVLDAWGDVGWYQFKFADAVTEKGDNARLHTGLIAQRIQSVFAAHNLDAAAYGLYCYDEWSARAEERDSEGNVITPAQEAGSLYSLRYEECLCMEAAYQRRRADRLEARIAAIEARLG